MRSSRALMFGHRGMFPLVQMTDQCVWWAASGFRVIKAGMRGPSFLPPRWATRWAKWGEQAQNTEIDCLIRLMQKAH